MILLLAADFLQLCIDGIVVGRSLYVANHTQGNGESVLGSHHGQLQLQGIVLAVGVMHQHVVQRVAILAYLHHLQAKALLHQSELIVLAKHQLLAVAHIDGILLAALVVVDHVVAVVVEDDAVLQHLSD